MPISTFCSPLSYHNDMLAFLYQSKKLINIKGTRKPLRQNHQFAKYSINQMQKVPDASLIMLSRHYPQFVLEFEIKIYTSPKERCCEGVNQWRNSFKRHISKQTHFTQESFQEVFTSIAPNFKGQKKNDMTLMMFVLNVNVDSQ